MLCSESVLNSANRIRQLAASLKSIIVVVEESQKSMALLNGLRDQYDPLISTLDTLGSEDTYLKFEFVKSHVMQEEQRIDIRSNVALSKSESAGLVTEQHDHNAKSRNHPRPNCPYCVKLGHHESSC